jgi:hypothetical protein
MDHLGFVEAVDGFGESIVVAVTDAADRGLDARRGKPLGILDLFQKPSHPHNS